MTENDTNTDVVTVRYDGPAEQFSHELGVATGGSAVLEPGREYDLPEDVAVGLVNGTAGWSYVGAPPASAGIGGANADKAIAAVGRMDAAQLAGARSSEEGRAKPRKSVLEAIHAREAELSAEPIEPEEEQ